MSAEIVPILQGAVPARAGKPTVEPVRSGFSNRAPASSRRRKDKANPAQSMIRETTVRSLEAAELREWLRRLNLTPRSVAVLLGRSEAVVYMWLSGDHVVPPYVTSWIELLAAFDRVVREYVPMEAIKGLIVQLLQDQPHGTGLTAERVSQRLNLPIGVIREAMLELTEQGLVS